MKRWTKAVALLAAVALLGALAACSGGTDGTYKIGICQLVQHPALDEATRGFQEALQEKLGDKVTFDLQNASGDSPTCTSIINGFVSGKVDLILANATTPLQAAAAATTTIPILGTSVTDYGTALDITDWTGTSGRNVSGTTDLAPLDGQAKIIAEMFPEAKNVGILYCSAEPNSKYQAVTIQPFLADLGMTVTEYTFSDSNDLAAVLGSAVAVSDVIYVPTDNTAASNAELIKNVTVPAGIPVVTGEENACRGCGVATLSISYYDIGYKTGEMAYEILVNKADITKMSVEAAPEFTKLYNAELCTALGITPPEGYAPIAE